MSSQIQITGETKVKSLTGVLVGTTGVVSSLNIDGSLGIPQLDVNGKILVSQLPNSVMEYKGVWNAATNSPTLTNGGAFSQGDVYLCDTAGTVNFGAGPITFVVSDQVIYSGSIWQKASGTNGTVTSVGLSTNAGAITIGSSPITTSGTITANFNGTNLQYVNGAGNLTTFPTLITSIGLTMPSAFSVANSPLTANGTIAVTGAGVASQYIRGDGTLANFPTSGGGGSSVAYYFNSSVSQGTLGGVAYRELSKVPIIGAGTDITIATNGYIANYITDAGDPSLLEIPAGNWNFEMFFSASSGGGSPSFYLELYKYDGTTFTLISSSSATPEGITNGTAIDLYTTALAVPLTTLTLTDRLAIRVYVNNSSRTITLHTENSHLCEVITTFSTGIAALNGLTAQVQYFQVGTSGTDFNISSTTATHTFNIPDASATARGLITTGTQTIGGTKTFTNIIIGDSGLLIKNGVSPTSSGYTGIGAGTSGINVSLGAGGGGSLIFQSTSYSYTFPAATGTLALTSDISYPVTSVFGRTGAVVATSGDYTTAQVTESGNLYFTDSRARLALSFVAGSGAYNSTTGVITIPTNNNQITNGAGYTTNVGTVTSVSATGGTGISITGSPITTSGTITITNTAPDQTVALTASTGISVTGTYPNFTITNTSPSSGGTVTSVSALTIGTSGTDLSSTVANSTTTPVITLNVPTASATNRGALASADWTTFNNKYNLPSLTSGSVLFSNGSTIAQDNANFFWDDTNNRLGIGTATPAFKLSVIGGNANTLLLDNDNSQYVQLMFQRNSTANTGFDFLLDGTNSTINMRGLAVMPIVWSTSTSAGTPTEKMRLTTSGNLGLGVTPSAWSGITALQVNNASLSGWSSDNTAMFLGANNYFDGTNFRYISSNFANQYRQQAGDHYWFNAPSGTAGNAITFTQAMTLFANGNLAVGTTTDSGYKLDVNGTGRFSGTITSSTGNNTRLFTSIGATTGYQYMDMYNTTGRLVWGINGSTANAIASNSLAYGGVLYASNSLQLGVDGDMKLTIASTGNVGIGTNNPSMPLTIQANTGNSAIKLIGTSNASTNNAAIFWYDSNDSTFNGYLGNFSGSFDIYNHRSTPMVLYTGGTARLTIASTGAATINAPTTDYALTVNGTALWYTARFIGSATTGQSYGPLITAGSNSSDQSFIVKSAGSSNYFVVRGDGNVGIATVNPTTKLQIANTSAGAATVAAFLVNESVTTNTEVRLAFAANTNNDIATDRYSYISAINTSASNGQALKFATNETGAAAVERMRITSGGNVGIGTSSPTSKLEVIGSTSNVNGYSDGSIQVTGTNPIAFVGPSNLNPSLNRWGFILREVTDGDFSIRNYRQSTTPLMIKDNGAVCINVTSAYGTNLLNVNGGIYATSSIAAVVAADIDMFVFSNTGATYSKACVVASMTATGGTGSYFFYGQQSTSTVALKIFSNGNIQNTNNSYGAISDARLKENIKDATPKLDDLMKVKVRNYNLKGESNKQLGVISQELEAIFPNMIEESTNMGENMKIKGVKYSVFVPMLIKAVQEQQQQINELKQLINK